MHDAGALPAFYFETRFRVALPPTAWPRQFAIVTAYATTGERWSDVANADADERLRQQLGASGLWHHRVTGYSPRTAHAEPGWAVAMAPQTARQLATSYLQHAIYTVEDDQLWVLRCEDGYRQAVGPFPQRLDTA